ncbi:RES family NAD+ phosphorylase [Streptomyces sp. NPDC088124]|uniref:RES family NAD+ phosphorylase n=1 Tax=Streptomyces sp. NPDC088124 TaxID=3154654 RepID=UPI003423B233
MNSFFPMTPLELSPNRQVVPAGTELWRVHKSTYAPDQFNPTLADVHDHRAGSRFDGTALDPYHSLYLAADPTTALAESVLRSRPFDPRYSMRYIPWITVRGRSLSALRTRCDLSLVSLIGERDLAAVCQDSTLLEDERNYPQARRWASEIRAQTPDIVGLVWQSRRNRPQHALVLFHDRFGDCGGCDGKPLEVLLDGGIADLGSDAGVDRANELLEPLRSEISRPVRP